MPQTLLGVLALVLAMLVSFNQKRNSAHQYELMVQNEIEMAATGALMHSMELIGSRSFDERSTPEGIHATQTIPEDEALFADEGVFGSTDQGSDGCNLEDPYLTPDCDDIDDISGLQGNIINAELSNGSQLPFEVDLDVSYVQDRLLQVPSDHPTRHKLVVIQMNSEYLPYGSITLERVFSYDPIKAEMDYEVLYGPLGTTDPGEGPPGGECPGGGGGGEIGGC